jgi:hypothetical protein
LFLLAFSLIHFAIGRPVARRSVHLGNRKWEIASHHCNEVPHRHNPPPRHALNNTLAQLAQD